MRKSKNISFHLLRKYDLSYSLNQSKFNKQIFLPTLSKILNKIIGKKIEYNIINLKSIVFNTDLFTNALTLKIKKSKRGLKNIFNMLNKTNIVKISKRTVSREDNIDLFIDKYKDSKIISYLNNNNINKLLVEEYSSKTKTIHNIIYNSIGYKNIRGIRMEVKGRLTKRYRADRPVHIVR